MWHTHKQLNIKDMKRTIFVKINKKCYASVKYCDIVWKTASYLIDIEGEINADTIYEAIKDKVRYVEEFVIDDIKIL